MSVTRFALTYLVLMGAFFILIGFEPIKKIIDLNGIYTHAVVAITTKVLNITGIQCSSQGSIISLPSISLDVKFGCNGLEAVMIYAVAVMAFPATWRNKLFGVFAGFVVIQIVNILRIAALAYAGIHFKGIFEYIHVYVAQGVMIAVSLAIFFIYLSYVKHENRSLA